MSEDELLHMIKKNKTQLLDLDEMMDRQRLDIKRNNSYILELSNQITHLHDLLKQLEKKCNVPPAEHKKIHRLNDGSDTDSLF